MAMAEFGLDGALHRANDNYLQLMGFTREQSLGRPHRSFCSARLADSARYREIWTHLCAGNAYSGVVERLRSDGSSCWLEATYSPVMDAQGRVMHILKIATDVTQRRAREQAQQEHLRRLSLVADASTRQGHQ
jgi:PAS domain S-box-containing protein